MAAEGEFCCLSWAFGCGPGPAGLGPLFLRPWTQTKSTGSPQAFGPGLELQHWFSWASGCPGQMEGLPHLRSHVTPPLMTTLRTSMSYGPVRMLVSFKAQQRVTARVLVLLGAEGTGGWEAAQVAEGHLAHLQCPGVSSWKGQRLSSASEECGDGGWVCGGEGVSAQRPPSAEAQEKESGPGYILET